LEGEKDGENPDGCGINFSIVEAYPTPGYAIPRVRPDPGKFRIKDLPPLLTLIA